MFMFGIFRDGLADALDLCFAGRMGEPVVKSLLAPLLFNGVQAVANKQPCSKIGRIASGVFDCSRK